MADEDKSKIMKFGAIFFVVLMIGSLFAVSISYLLNNDSDSNTTNTTTNNTTAIQVPISDMPGKEISFTYTNLKDGVKHLPEGTLSAQVSKIYPTDRVSQMFPGANVSQVLIGSYPAGILEYYTVGNESGSVNISGNATRGPQYDKYNNYSLLIASTAPQYIVPGNPLLLASYNVDLAHRALDVADGGNKVSTNFDYILSKTDDVSTFEEMIVFRSNNGSDYEQYYQRSSSFSNGTYQMEGVLLNATSGLKQDLTNQSLNASKNGVSYKISDNGDIFKYYMESTNGVSFVSESSALKKTIEKHTKTAN
ncbi:hypothetical protein [Methanolapillus ohkumae]|uniref:Uncharacterized protein n=1 Tax=Methanolapillus ohkumae TaxID=3028298 RepID=A0AA96V749_9EURY|nr:hypothetical protein MsAm2_05820 [Methanosarcinaceae archaeon Am2]